jgi:hypothetical protein
MVGAAFMPAVEPVQAVGVTAAGVLDVPGGLPVGPIRAGSRERRDCSNRHDSEGDKDRQTSHDQTYIGRM